MTGVIRLMMYLDESHTFLFLGDKLVESLGGFHRALGPTITLVDCEEVPIVAVVGITVVVIHS